jgi:hypothetical protein
MDAQPTLGWALLGDPDMELDSEASTAPRTLLRIDCDGCEWQALAEMLEQGGPHALSAAGVAAIDWHARLDVPLPEAGDFEGPGAIPVPKLGALQTMAAAVALLQADGFVPVWSRPQWPDDVDACSATTADRDHGDAPSDSARVGAAHSGPLLDAMTRLFGASIAQTYEANAATVQRIQAESAEVVKCEGGTAEAVAPALARPGSLFCCWRIVLVRLASGDGE